MIVVAGTKAARYGEVIAVGSGLGRIRVGLLLLAFISAMPELVTGISSVTLVHQPDLGVGTLVGSCLFNLTIIALMDVFYRRSPVLNAASRRNLRLALVGCALLTIVALAIGFREGLDGLALGWVGLPTLLVGAVYLSSLWWISRAEAQQAPAGENAPAKVAVASAWLKLALAGLFVIGAGIMISYVAEEIDAVTGWGASFVGSLFLAVATSIPEVVIAIAAFRMGAIDLAVADILGANMFDLANLLTLDLFYTDGPLLSLASGSHLITALAVLVMTLVVVAGLYFRPRRKTFRLVHWYAVVLVAIYLGGAYALFTAGGG